MITEADVAELRAHLTEFNLFTPLDVLVVGATGAGKSSTINALMGSYAAPVGHGVAPETMVVAAYQLHEFLRLHDSPGLGDTVDADAKHSRQLERELSKVFLSKGTEYGLVDLVLVILDGSSRDYGTAYALVSETILRLIEPDRVVLAINQCDMAMKGRHWDKDRNLPDAELEAFLYEKAESAARRIREATGLAVAAPVYYSAAREFNIRGLLSHIIAHLPKSRRCV